MRGWDKHLPGRILGALPKRKWVKRLQRVGQEVLMRLWRHVADKSPATQSRWQWTWVGDDSVFKKYGQQLGLVGTWYSGQEHRVRLGIDGLLLLVVIGEGKLVVPLDFEVRRPDPVGPGGPCRAASHVGPDVGGLAPMVPLALVRQHLWRARYVVNSAAAPEFVQLPREAFERLLIGLPIAA